MHYRPGLIALVAGVASATGFAPLGLWPVTFICFALLAGLIARAASLRQAFARGWLFGVGHFTLGMNWIAHAFDFQDAMPHWLGYVAVFVLALYLAVYPALGAALTWWLAGVRRMTGAALPLCFAGCWAVSEYLRAELFTGFAWNPLAAIFVGTPMAGVATVIGTYGVSALVALIAALFAAAAGDRRWLAAGGTVLGGVALTGAALTWTTPPATLTLVRIVQHNTNQSDRHDTAHDEISVRNLERLSGRPGPTPRLILWPEAAAPYFLEEEPWARERLAAVLGPKDLLLTGGDALIYDADGKVTSARNALFAITPTARIIARYDKAHLVPYGEYLPMRPLLTAIGLSRLVPGDLDFLPGPGPRTLNLPGFGSGGIQICYEIVFSGEVVDRAHRPDFLFNASTDAWFGAWGPPQHLAQAQLRAVEEGLPIMRATPTGISAVIDANGRLLKTLPRDRPGFIETQLPGAKSPTLFAQYGNPVPLVLAVLLGAAGVALGRRRR